MEIIVRVCGKYQMNFFFSIRHRKMAFAVTAALAALTDIACADDNNVSAPIQAAQTYVQASGTVDMERNNTAAVLVRINANYAYGKNITGKGVTIAMMDSGISATHREFAGAGKIATGFNAFNGTNDVTDLLGHGTHVAGILAANRDGKGIFGVAYDATLLPVKVLSDTGKSSISVLDAGLRYAIGKAAIVNMSLGTDVAYNPGALRQAVQAGMLIVAAAGNGGGVNPGWPARFAKESWANNQIIAVGAVDASNRIASFSNRAGDTAAWFLVAPGVNIPSSYLNGQYVYMSGTSMATPVVSGAAALLKQMWPALRAEQIANILFVTATDLGAPGIDPVYGRGLVNVEKALQPIGSLTTTTFNGKTINVLAGSTQVSSATTRLWSLAASGQLQVVGLDDYRRDFKLDPRATLIQPPGLSLDQVFGSMERRFEAANRVLPNGSKFVALYEWHRPLADNMGTSEAKPRLAAFSMTSSQADDDEFAVGSGGMAGHYFGASGLPLAEHLQLDNVTALAHPYFSLLPGATHAAWTRHIDGMTLRFGMLASGPGATLVAQDEHVPRARSVLFEAAKSFSQAALSLSLTRIDEMNGFLGAYSGGPLALTADASTHALQATGAVLLAPKLALAGQAAYAVTPGSLVNNSLITEVTKTRTNAFTLALVASDRFRTNDRLSIALSQPMRTYAGQIAMDMLTGLDADGKEQRERMQFSMAPLGRELRAEVNYLLPLRDAASIGTTLMLRHEPNNMIEVPMEKLLALRYTKQF